MTIKYPPRRFALPMLAALCPLDLYAERYFNPAFLSDDPGSVADLSLLEKGFQRPGSYRVDIWRNDEFITTQDIRFEREANSAAGEASGGLTPCSSEALLARLGVNMAAFPALLQSLISAKNQTLRPQPVVVSESDFTKCAR